MRKAAEFLRTESRARRFFVALAQSALGTGAGYVALLLLAYERFTSVWAISLVLLADLLPAMLLGPVFGAAADRWSRRTCLVLADVVRAGAFAGIAAVDGFGATLVLALAAGAGTGLFTPAALAALPSLTRPERLPVATSLYGAITDFGHMVGPAIAAGILLFAGPEAVMLTNAATFALSAIVVSRISFGPRATFPRIEADTAPSPALVREAATGLRTSLGNRPVRIVILASTAGLLCAGVFNVAELPFVRNELDLGSVGFSILVALFGAGIVAGSLVGARGGALPAVKRRYLAGLLLMAIGLLGIGLSFDMATAAVAFVGAGFGNGVMLVHERLLLQTVVADGLLGRVFGVKDAMTAWAFAIAFLAAPALIAAVGTRHMLLVSGAVAMVAWLIAAHTLRGTWMRPAPVRRGRWPRVPASLRRGS